MNEILTTIIDTLSQNRHAVFCGIVESSGSAPRTSGARMLVLPDGSIRGSVGGGPVEGASVTKALGMLEGDDTHRFLTFDLSSATAADAGMVCGGAVKVLLQRVVPEQRAFFEKLRDMFRERQRPSLVTVMREDSDPVLGMWSASAGLEGVGLPEAMAAELSRKASKARQNFRIGDGGVTVFAEPLIAPTVLHIVGAGHVALATSREAREVRVLENFEDCLKDLGPDDYVVIVTRGHLHDRDVLAQALRTEAGYIGMIGSRSKRDAVYRSLLESGYVQADIDRVFCPIGMSIGADTPEEIAVSIVGEMIRVRAGIPV